MNNKYQRAGFKDVFRYSFGGLGSNLAFYLAMSYLTFFYTDIFGINTMVVASLMLVSRFIDAFTDPIMGMMGDNTRSKMGRFRPWIKYGAPVLGLLTFMLFTAPELSPTMKIVYAYAVYIVYSLASTVVNIPYHALTPVISKDPQQRTEIVAWKQGMGTVAQFFITILAVPMVTMFGGGKQGWAIYGGIVAVLLTLSFWICQSGAKEYDVCEDTGRKESFNFRETIHLLTGNKPMIMLMIAFGTDVLANATYSAVNMYYFKYVLGREDLVAPVASAILFGGIASLPFLPMLSRIVGKKRLYWLGSAFSIVPLFVMLLRPTAPVLILMSAMAAFGFISRIPSNLGWAMLPECSDYAEWRYGKRADGLLSSSLTFINKFGMAIGGFIASFFLGLTGFVPNTAQNSATISMIVFLRFGMPIIGYIASLISMHFYEITDEKYKEIRAALDERDPEIVYNDEVSEKITSLS
ncbi:MAG: MFS transporter [Lachnospiraceae bacterium]|nr:MFS transporter [Lachnospiraceae bacterium]